MNKFKMKLKNCSVISTERRNLMFWKDFSVEDSFEMTVN